MFLKGKNSLSSLLGNYMSDSENEDLNLNDQRQTPSNSFTKEFDNLLDEITKHKNDTDSAPVTDWTQCMDPSTGHPYYWNISTKEVTWEKPEEYAKYQKEIEKFSTKLHDDYWTVGFSEGTETPYYVNEYTRVVSWEKPANFKEKVKEEKAITSKITTNISQATKKFRKSKKKVIKTPLPKHLEPTSDEDVKIVLISSFSAPSASSSDDEEQIKQSTKETPQKTSSAPKLKLVAEYTTDEESDTETSDQPLSEIVIPTPKSKEPLKLIQINVNSEIEPDILIASSCPSTTSPAISPQLSPKIEPTSFASIITGGKPDNCFDEEINKLKEELEKDLVSSLAGAADEQQNTEQQESNQICDQESNFDEKTFQRKRRIEFKTNKKPITLSTESNEQTESPRTGFGFTNDDSKDESEKENKKKTLYANFQRSHIEFDNKNEENRQTPKRDSDNVEQFETSNESCNEKEILKKSIADLSDIIAGKVKFLAVGHFEVSTVQAINIQLETLMSAFRSAALDIDYFFKWLKQTSDDLLTLEQNAAPDGWKCKWNRESSQYCYENQKTGTIEWEFPKTDCDSGSPAAEQQTDQNDKELTELDIIDENRRSTSQEKQILLVIEDKRQVSECNPGEDEMDISTTPPPNEHEQIKLEQHLPVWDADNAPPPPIISVPSPQHLHGSEFSFINNELASFYSDIADLDAIQQTPSTSENIDTNVDLNMSPSSAGNSNNKKRTADEGSATTVTIQKKKRKKVKVQGLGMKVNEVTNMVAKWQKAQKELSE